MNVVDSLFDVVKVSTEKGAVANDTSIRFSGEGMALVPIVSIDRRGPVQERLEKICLNFQISLNEEHAFLSILHGARAEIHLGERAHHYSLLTLARRRLDDAKNGLDPSSQGWMELAQLSRLLGIEPEHLNIQIFRARTQIIHALPQVAQLPSIIERRRGELRFGDHQFRIVRGSEVEGEYLPTTVSATQTEPRSLGCRI